MPVGSGSGFKILICWIRIRPKMDRIRNPVTTSLLPVPSGPHLSVNGCVVQLKAVADLNVPARLLPNQGAVHLGGLRLLRLCP